MATFCCISISFSAWLAYEIGQAVQSQLATSAASQADITSGKVVTFNGHDWDFMVIDAEYNPISERLVMISSHPHQLHIYDPIKGQDIQIPLSREPTAVTISLDGRFAAIGQSGQIEYINLDTGETINQAPISGKVADVVLPNSTWVYFSRADDNQRFYSIEWATYQEKSFAFSGNGRERTFQLAPDGRSLYGTSRGSEPGRLEKVDIAQGEPRFLYDAGDNVDTCGQVWLAEDGRFAVSGCGHIWGLADRKQDDMVLRGNLFAESEKIIALTHSATAARILLIAEENDAQVLLFDDAQFDLLSTKSLPVGTHGRFIFINAAGNQYYVIFQTDSGQYGLATGDL